MTETNHIHTSCPESSLPFPLKSKTKPFQKSQLSQGNPQKTPKFLFSHCHSSHLSSNYQIHAGKTEVERGLLRILQDVISLPSTSQIYQLPGKEPGGCTGAPTDLKLCPNVWGSSEGSSTLLWSLLHNSLFPSPSKERQNW